MTMQKVSGQIARLYPLVAPLAASTSRAIDLAWTQAVHGFAPLDPFFPKGWGNLQAVNWETDEKYFKAQPPDLQIQWSKIGEGELRGVQYEKLQGQFLTPHVDRMMAALPPESHMARVQLLQPKNTGPDTSLVLHLAGTGDHGFHRRLRIGSPLLSQNVATLALESPYYGTRRPAGQQGSRLHHVADLLALGRTTIMEGLCLLEWAHQQGYGRLGVTGLSMGGVHAAMIAGLCKHPVAVSPHLAPRSAAVAFCEGALNRATAFGPLAENDITCDYIRSVADSLPHKPDLKKIPSIIDPVGVQRLATVLETYTDVTRYPRPLRADAAVIVAATDDAYVSRESPIQVQQHWPGSEVRWVTGGHVLSFIIHGSSFRRSIMDSLERLETSSLCQPDEDCALAV
mmetsp:Transcript_25198/g.70464  ORF Transcript_25198/g.70464 Transcript_25198/m.70464 type:complete len:399 (-) Transcript_25198:148-1344(-)